VTFRFGAFELDASGELRRSGRQIKLQQQPFKVLLSLVQRQGEVVTREELRALLWAEGTHVEFERGLNFAVSRVRDALGDNARAPRFVETLPRRGYRFLAPVEELGDAAPRPMPALSIPPPPPPPRRSYRPVLAAAAVLLLATAMQAGRPRAPLDPEALRFYEEARSLCGPDGWRRSIRLYAEAARRARSFPAAWVGMARSYVKLTEHGALRPRQAFPQARAAALEALRRGESAEARVLLATVLLEYDRRPELAAAELDKAEALLLDGPNREAAPVLARVARLRSYMGDDRAALEAARHAEALDPGDEDVVMELAACLQRAGELVEAARVWRGVAAALPQAAHQALFWIQRERGLHEEALSHAREVMRAAGVPEDAVAAVMAAGPAEGAHMYLRGSIRFLTGRADYELVEPERLALLHAALGDAEDALRLLQEGAEGRSPMLLGALRDPNFAPLRGDPRWRALHAATLG